MLLRLMMNKGLLESPLALKFSLLGIIENEKN